MSTHQNRSSSIPEYPIVPCSHGCYGKNAPSTTLIICQALTSFARQFPLIPFRSICIHYSTRVPLLTLLKPLYPTLPSPPLPSPALPQIPPAPNPGSRLTFTSTMRTCANISAFFGRPPAQWAEICDLFESDTCELVKPTDYQAIAALVCNSFTMEQGQERQNEKNIKLFFIY